MALKEVISNIAIVLDAQKPTETHKVLFKDVISDYDATNQEETFRIRSYKVIDDQASEYEFLKEHVRTLDKPTLDALRASITITETDYTEVRNEELIRN